MYPLRLTIYMTNISLINNIIIKLLYIALHIDDTLYFYSIAIY